MRRTVRLVGIGVLAFLVVAPWAHAQETPAPASQKPATAAASGTNWEGVYVGANIGLMPRTFDFGASTETINQVSGVIGPGGAVIVVPATTVSIPASSPGSTAFVAGVLAGYNKRFDRWLGGVEASLDFGVGSTTSTFTSMLPATPLTPNIPVTFDRTASANVIWSLRGRAGYVWHDDYLVYGTAGIAGASVELTATDTWTDPGGAGTAGVNLGPLGPYVTTATESHHRVGFTFGGGVEWAATSAMIIGVEYRHTAFGTGDYALANPTIAINGPLPSSGTGAQALPGPTTVGLSENRVVARLTMKWGFWRQ